MPQHSVLDSEIKLRATTRFVAATAAGARQSEMKLSEYIRAAIRDRLERDGVPLSSERVR